MNTKQIKIIDCFTPLIVYTLEFAQNSQDPRYTMEKLANDYEQLIQEAKERSALSEEAFMSALFPVVAWIDEVVLSSQNTEKKQWRKQLLQKDLFDTSNAGFEFYEQLDALDKEDSELRFLYLYCMFLGFKGRYYHSDDSERLEAIFTTQKSLLEGTFLESFPTYAFQNAYAQNRLPSENNFQTSYYGVGIVIFLSLTLALISLLASQVYLNTLLDKNNVF
jgi:type VI secretion system protein ImpK